MIPKRRLGKTDIEVSPIGLGVLQFAGGHGFFNLIHHKLTQKSMNDIVGTAIAGGVNWFDTAEIYGGGSAERSLAIALKAKNQDNSDVVVATKWFPIMRTARNISKTIDSRLQCLDGFGIDLYQVHFPYYLSSTNHIMDQILRAT